MHKNLRRSVVALATAFACLGIMAGPSSAATSTHPVTITGGTVTATSTTGQVITTTLGGTAGTGCSSTLSVLVDNTAGTINATTFTSIGHFTLGTNHYVSTSTRTASTTGTFGSGSVSSVGISISVVIRAAANNSSTDLGCATTGTTICTLRATLAFAGTYTGSPSTTGAAAFDISAPGAAISLGIGTCNVPFATFNGGTAVVTNLTGTF